MPSSGFNSKLVRLKAGIDSAVREDGKIGFNSKLVRLKVPGVHLRRRYEYVFQFQTGAIKSFGT